jgi:hypothetical protein
MIFYDSVLNGGNVTVVTTLRTVAMFGAFLIVLNHRCSHVHLSRLNLKYSRLQFMHAEYNGANWKIVNFYNLVEKES